MRDLDLRLLTVFQEIARTRSVSAAAEALGMAQPTVSIALGKLRRRFGDPLFVRTSGGMMPTPFAARLQQPLADALDLLARTLDHEITFDAGASERDFRVAMTDISQVVLLPRLLDHLKGTAPRVTLDVRHIDDGTPRALEAGDAELAIGFMPQLEAGFHQQTLFTQRYVCLARADHPRIGDRLTLKRFVAESHVQVAWSGTGHRLVEKALADAGIVRTIALRLPGFLGLAAIIGQSDLLVTVPGRLAEALAGTQNLKALKPPIDFPPYAVKLHWHERVHRDPGHQWLRKTLLELFR